MVDPEHRLRVLRFDGETVEEIATLKASAKNELELAHMAAALALMAGEKNGSVKKVAKAQPEPVALPAAKEKVKRQKPRGNHNKFRADYAPDLSTQGGRILLTLEEHGPMLAVEIADETSLAIKNVSPALSNYKHIGVVEIVGEATSEKGRTISRYGLTQHGRDSLVRARES